MTKIEAIALFTKLAAELVHRRLGEAHMTSTGPTGSAIDNPDVKFPLLPNQSFLMQNMIPPYLYASYLAEETARLAKKLTEKRFWWIGDVNNSQIMIYDSATRLIWDADPDISKAVDIINGKSESKLSQLNTKQLDGWRLPEKEEITDFSSALGNPLQKGIPYRLLNKDYWLCADGRIDLDRMRGNLDKSATGAIIGCNDFASGISDEKFIYHAMNKQWQLRACGQQNAADLLAPLLQNLDLKEVYKNIDHFSCRLPPLEPAQFTDPNKGLWEFCGMDAEVLAAQGLRSRNPADDVKDWNVAIDFGTSSTVVAYDDNGKYKLLRIGVKDFWEKEKPEHYENPTVLEIIDFPALIEAWQSVPYRPCVQWSHVRCSHEAQHNFRHNETKPEVVASILSKIKQWALREGDGSRLRLTDQINRLEHELEPLTLRMPVKGQPLNVSSDDPFDPVELYAWFLGLTINWRGRGIFLRYYMTFPIAYPKEVKEKILASFRRGLQRSLPATLIGHSIFDNFSIEECASEPAAYAATALQHLAIEPTVDGVAYGVFDFGGGTADFDFGFYRLPNAEEDDEGWEKVFEHFGAAGDKFLGGENLLENLAYRVFLHNLDLCRKHKIGFTRPLDADDFAGSEMFLEKTQAAATNTLMLMARLRPLWERGELPNASGIEKIDLLSREGQKIACELTIPVEDLEGYLANRIEQGVYNFFAALRKAFADKLPEHVHLLLAGNASRSWLVSEFFGLSDEDVESGRFACTRKYLEKLFGDKKPEITTHPPLPIDENDVYRPTAKTGVALGLLHLCPGGVIKVINHAADISDGEAPFTHYVGRIRHGRFQVGINQGDSYGRWRELGVPRERVFNLHYSQSPKAHTNEMREGDPELYKMRLDLTGNTPGQKVFARPKYPAVIEICTAISADDIERGQLENLREINLM